MQPEEKPANSTNPVEGQVNVIIAAVQEESRNQTTDTSTSLENNVFTWKNVKNSVPVGTRKERHEKVLLDGISGMFLFLSFYSRYSRIPRLALPRTTSLNIKHSLNLISPISSHLISM